MPRGSIKPLGTFFERKKLVAIEKSIIYMFIFYIKISLYFYIYINVIGGDKYVF